MTATRPHRELDPRAEPDGSAHNVTRPLRERFFTGGVAHAAVSEFAAWLTRAMRRDVRSRVEQRHASVRAAAPTVQEQLFGAFGALADCTQWLEPAEDKEREHARRQRLSNAAVETLAYLAAALSGSDGSVTSALDKIEQELARFAVHGEHGAVNPTTGESPAVDVSTALHAIRAALAATDADEVSRYVIRAAASASLVAEIR